MERTEEYDKVIEGVKDKYGERILAYLSKLSKAACDAGLFADEPAEMFDDTFRWTFCVWKDQGAFDKRDYEKSIDNTLRLDEAREYGDDEGYPFGINFSLDIVENGGLIVGQFAPYNYTDECWVNAKDKEAVENRWSMFESMDAESFPAAIKEHYGTPA